MNDFVLRMKAYDKEDLRDSLKVVERLRTIADYDDFSFEKVMKFLHFGEEESYYIKNGIYKAYDFLYDLYQAN